MDKIDWSLPIETTGTPPRPVRVLCTNAGGDYPVVILLPGVMDNCISRRLLTGGINPDIRNVPEDKPAPVLRGVWVNLYENGRSGTPCSTETYANSVHDMIGWDDRIECRRITWMSDGSPVPGELPALASDYEQTIDALKAEIAVLRPIVDSIDTAMVIYRKWHEEFGHD